MKRMHVLAITFLAGLVVGCSLPAHAETFQCKGVLLDAVTGEPSMTPIDEQFSLETHQGLSELAYKNSSSKWAVIGTADLNNPVEGDGSISPGTYKTTFKRPRDGFKIVAYQVGSGLVVESGLFRSICTKVSE